MFGFFKSKESLVEENEELSFKLELANNNYDDILDSLNTARNVASEAERKMLEMARYRDPNNVAELADNTAKRIEDLYVWSWKSVGQRSNAIRIEIENLIKSIQGSID